VADVPQPVVVLVPQCETNMKVEEGWAGDGRAQVPTEQGRSLPVVAHPVLPEGYVRGGNRSGEGCVLSDMVQGSACAAPSGLVLAGREREFRQEQRFFAEAGTHAMRKVPASMPELKSPHFLGTATAANRALERKREKRETRVRRRLDGLFDMMEETKREDPQAFQKNSDGWFFMLEELLEDADEEEALYGTRVHEGDGSDGATIAASAWASSRASEA
jgi:hypothetical protein